MNPTFTQAVTGKIEKHKHCQKNKSQNKCNEEERSRSTGLFRAFPEALLVLTDAISHPPTPRREDKQHSAPLNECSAFSIHLLWLQLLSFVSDRYFCTPCEVTVICRMKADKRATFNSPMKIAEFSVLLCLGLILYDIMHGSFFPIKLSSSFSFLGIDSQWCADLRKCLGQGSNLFFIFILFIGCTRSQLQHVGSLVMACELLVAAWGI